MSRRTTLHFLSDILEAIETIERFVTIGRRRFNYLGCCAEPCKKPIIDSVDMKDFFMSTRLGV